MSQSGDQTALEKDSFAPTGPFSYANWIAADQGLSRLSGCEVPLYSDAYIIGTVEQGCGPYQFINIVSEQHQSMRARPVIMLRAWNHFSPKIPSSVRSDTSAYHGGGAWDEIAALLSLDLGVRLRSSNPTRHFTAEAGDIGRPYPEIPERIPMLPTFDGLVSSPYGRRVGELVPKRIGMYPKLKPDQAVALIRAARSYQNALWVADADQNLAWLMFVSAIEAAACYWAGDKAVDPITVFKATKPEWALRLERDDDQSLLEYMAKELLPITGSTNKFISFIDAHFPPEPSRRASSMEKVDWDKVSFKKAMKQIYGYRSKALHGGIPFPAPMLRAIQPAAYDEEGKPLLPERPVFIASSEAGGSWTQDDIPMYLHVFEHVVRYVLIRWWEEMATQNMMRLPDISNSL